MRLLILVIGLIIPSVGGIYPPPRPPSQSASLSPNDIALFWRESSGPNGERDAATLPLYRAIFSHDYRRAVALLENGTSANAVLYNRRWSPLMVAIANQDQNMVYILVRHHANLNYVSDVFPAPTPLTVALSTAMADALERGRDSSGMNLAIFHYLLDRGADVNLEFGYKQDIAIFAAVLGQFEVVKELLSRNYRRDLSLLRIVVEKRHVTKENEREKGEVIAAIDELR